MPAERAGQGEVGGMHLKGANSMTASGLGYKKGLAIKRPWLALGGPFLSSFT